MNTFATHQATMDSVPIALAPTAKQNRPAELLSAAPQPPRRRMYVRHVTRYSYDQAIERSVHQLHLRPITNERQRLVAHRIKCNHTTTMTDYEDVFGNIATRFELTQPYTQLEIDAESVVDIIDDDPFAFANRPQRPTFPLAWMPWETTMLATYLTPMELPETQMEELLAYGLSFVERNNRDLMETLFELNLTIFREYKYSPGSTAFETTPFDVLSSKQGVCQDFSNLLICLARLLGIPARYACGYVHCPQVNAVQSLESHAWVELYIPKVGWKGFDPTNGVLPRLDHIRVAVGRHYIDTAPTSGTIYTQAKETMTTEVSVTEVERLHPLFDQTSEMTSPPTAIGAA